MPETAARRLSGIQCRGEGGHHDLHLLDVTQGALGAPDTIEERSTGLDDKRRRLLCVICANPITSPDQRVDIGGGHQHTRTNPSGFSYCFGCFAEAPGCACVGRSSFEHTWFPGCNWQIAVCRGCGEHLGWRFRGVHAFHALILDRLVAGKAH